MKIKKIFRGNKTLGRHRGTASLVTIDLDKRYVRFLTRVNVARDRPYQLAPQFPVHLLLGNTQTILNFFNDRKKQLLAVGQSDRDANAIGDVLASDLKRMQLQLKNDTWAVEHLNNSLKEIETIKPFQALQP